MTRERRAEGKEKIKGLLQIVLRLVVTANVLRHPGAIQFHVPVDASVDGTSMGPTCLPAPAAQFERMLLASIDSQLQISPSVVKVTSRA
jgi:hypothetical protein